VTSGEMVTRGKKQHSQNVVISMKLWCSSSQECQSNSRDVPREVVSPPSARAGVLALIKVLVKALRERLGPKRYGERLRVEGKT
jgi:hypothetical protein